VLEQSWPGSRRGSKSASFWKLLGVLAIADLSKAVVDTVAQSDELRIGGHAEVRACDEAREPRLIAGCLIRTSAHAFLYA
jgi:hypothetical protein